MSKEENAIDSLHLETISIAKTGMLIRKPATQVFEAVICPSITTKVWFTRSSGRLEPGKQVRWEWEMYGVSTQVTLRVLQTLDAASHLEPRRPSGGVFSAMLQLPSKALHSPFGAIYGGVADTPSSRAGGRFGPGKACSCSRVYVALFGDFRKALIPLAPKQTQSRNPLPWLDFRDLESRE